LVPLALQFRGSVWHKFAGRIAAADIVIAALTAIPVALENPLTNVTAAGFVVQAILWLTLLVVGVWNIKRGKIRAHQNSMLLMAAVTSGALFFRVFLAGFAAFGGHAYFKMFYSIDAWVGWGVPFALCLVWLIRSHYAARRECVGPRK
jgi:uncharacterized membrane protein YozB (DUF420 family)